MSLNNKAKLVEIANAVCRELRKNSTGAERLFWEKVRNKNFLGKKFYRQHPIFHDIIGKETFFVADFYCFTDKIIIELDGKYHKYRLKKDVERTKILNHLGLNVIRFSNDEIVNNLEEVLLEIKKHFRYKPEVNSKTNQSGINKIMNPKQWYEELFENYGKTYDKESFTQGTIGECDFIEKELNFNKSLKILDVGCGTGRHSIELSKRGYSVTGIDLSESQLARARQKGIKENLKIEFQKHDARNLPFDKEFDAAIMLCEGAFPLMETDEMNFEILKNVTKSLKDKSKFIFTTLNGLFPLYHSVENFCAVNSVGDNATYRSNTFDLMTFRDHNITEIIDDSGNKKTLDCSERYYVPSEISWLLKSLGYKKIDIFGAKLGAFSRNEKLTTEDFEMLVVAEK